MISTHLGMISILLSVNAPTVKRYRRKKETIDQRNTQEGDIISKNEQALKRDWVD